MSFGDDLIVVCARTDELEQPDGAATRTYCEQCHTQVWIADSTPRVPGMHILCEPCAFMEMATDDKPEIITRRELLDRIDNTTQT